MASLAKDLLDTASGEQHGRATSMGVWTVKRKVESGENMANHANPKSKRGLETKREERKGPEGDEKLKKRGRQIDHGVFFFYFFICVVFFFFFFFGHAELHFILFYLKNQNVYFS